MLRRLGDERVAAALAPGADWGKVRCTCPSAR